jgi:hypothetical protein
MKFEIFFNNVRSRLHGRWHINTSGHDWFLTKKDAMKEIKGIESALKIQKSVSEIDWDLVLKNIACDDDGCAFEPEIYYRLQKLGELN